MKACKEKEADMLRSFMAKEQCPQTTKACSILQRALQLHMQVAFWQLKSVICGVCMRLPTLSVLYICIYIVSLSVQQVSGYLNCGFVTNLSTSTEYYTILLGLTWLISGLKQTFYKNHSSQRV